jgi:outer membrane protein OmpA-like peptidoglycan-associated protein
MAFGVRLTIVAAALSVFGTGCIATEEWTQELFAKRQVVVDERFVKVESDVREHGDRLERVEVRMADLGNGLTETRDLLKGVVPAKANAVVARSSAPVVAPLAVPNATPPHPGRTLVGVVHVPFAFDRADLDVSAEAALTAILNELRDNPYVTLDLEGATDPVGRLDYNIKLSQRRVEVVKRWLVDKGVEPNRIVGATARGPLPDASVKNDLKRRVMVKLMRTE